MKDPVVLNIDEVVARFDEFDAVLDARSESEFAEDRLPRAISAPVLNDAERALVGTVYKQRSSFEAKKLGAPIVARNVANLIDTRFAGEPREWRPLVYCWRGGNRSGALATLLARIGWRVALLEGGYREFRRRVIADLADWPQRLQFRVLAGRTGCGKSLILQRLAALGAQVLDLEALANHRGSVLGLLPESVQPSQKLFESRLWDALRRFDATRPVFVEAESKKVGNLTVPDSLMSAMRASPCVRLALSLQHRVQLLLEDYTHFVVDADHFCERLERLVDLRGRATVEGWQAQVRAGQTPGVVAELLQQHYDPGYESSTARNFARYAKAPTLALPSPEAADMQRAAQQLVQLAQP